MARLNKDSLRGLKLISAARSNRKLSCTETGRTCALRLRAGFFRFGISGSAIGSSSCIQIPFSMSYPSPRWFISDGRARLRAWAAIADEHHRTERFETVNAWADRPRCLRLSSPLVSPVSTVPKRSEQREALGVYFLDTRVTRYGVQDHCPAKVLGGQGATLLLVGKPHGWGNAPLSKQSSADSSALHPLDQGLGFSVFSCSLLSLFLPPIFFISLFFQLTGGLNSVVVVMRGDSERAAQLFGYQPHGIGDGARLGRGFIPLVSIGCVLGVAASDAAMQGASGNAS